MLLKLRRNREYNTIGHNIIYLTILNIVNYLFPIIIIPYLTNIIGVEFFGKFTFSYSVLLYIAIFVMYGFDYSATRLVALNKNSLGELIKIFNSIIIIRLMFASIASVVIIILIQFIDKLFEIRFLLYSGLGILFGLALFPVWLFQGLENMKFITIINSITKTIAGLAILFLIRRKEQYVFINAIYSISYLVSGLFGLALARNLFKIRFQFPGLNALIFQIKDGWSLFTTTVGMAMYRELNTIILGGFYDFTVVGYYTAAERIVKGVQVMISPFTQALYPYFSRKFDSDKETSDRHFQKIGKVYVLFLIFTMLFVFSLAHIICRILGDDFLNSILNLRILSLVIVFGGLNYYYGILGMVSQGYSKQFSKIIWIAGICSILLCLFFSYLWADVGASINLVVSELILFILIVSFKNYRQNGVINSAKRIK
jgi:PST family polysaccharide transporter